MDHSSNRISIHEKVKNLPDKPGVYQFLSSSGEILYIGKAKNLKKRVNSYFVRFDQHNYKQEVLVRKIEDIHYIIVDDESDALLLENNLIKENQPRYNILLKDDKTYPWIVITRDRFPRVMLTRNYIEDGSDYYGPYTSVMMAKTMLDMIRQLYKLRTCKLNLSQDNIEKGKFRRCLEFDLGNCLAPCEDLQTESDYMNSISQIREILKGNYQQVIIQFKRIMIDLARKYNFEQAERIRLKIEILEKYKGKSTVVNPKISHVDVYSMVDEENAAYINFMKVVNGAIIQSHNVEVIKKISELKEEILAFVIFDLRERFRSDSKEIIVPFIPEILPENIKVSIPVRGDRKKLLDLSERNARSYKRDLQMAKVDSGKLDKTASILNTLQKDLRLKNEPGRIECFDNSNIQGTNPVASCVVFVQGRPKKSEYRHFNVKSVSGPDDFATMEEIISRRYGRVLKEGGQLPDLIIVDGGKGQLSAALKSLDVLKLREKVAIIGIAKRLEEIYVPEDPFPLYLDKNSVSLRLIQQIRNEAHRFGINFHRKKRELSFFDSELDKISGIGKATKERILKQLKDIQQLRYMDVEEIKKIAGPRAAKILKAYFQTKN